MRVLRPPSGPFRINRQSKQSAGLVSWWPPGRYPGIAYGVPDGNGRFPAVTNGTLLSTVWDPVMGWAIDYVADSNRFIEPTPGNSQVLSPTDAMTIASWFNADVVTGDNKLFDRDASGSRGYSFQVNTRALNWIASGVGTVSGGTLSVGTTYLAMITGDPAHGWYLYLNGVQVGSAAWRSPGSSTAYTKISRGNYTSYYGPFNGRIGDTRLYNRYFTAAEAWQMWDPLTRWELYDVQRRVWVLSPGGAPPSGRRRSWATIIGG